MTAVCSGLVPMIRIARRKARRMGFAALAMPGICNDSAKNRTRRERALEVRQILNPRLRASSTQRRASSVTVRSPYAMRVLSRSMMSPRMPRACKSSKSTVNNDWQTASGTSRRSIGFLHVVKAARNYITSPVGQHLLLELVDSPLFDAGHVGTGNAQRRGNLPLSLPHAVQQTVAKFQDLLLPP